MEHAMFDTTMWGLIWQSDIVTKSVLLILMVLSIFCWAIALYKFILLRIKKAQCDAMIRSLHSVQTFKDLHALARGNSHTLPGYFLSQFLFVFSFSFEFKFKLLLLLFVFSLKLEFLFDVRYITLFF